MNLSEALAFTCADHFLQVHQVFLECSRNINITYGKITTSDYTSWLAKGAHFFTIIQHEKQTIVFCHANQTMFYASPHIKLNASTPDGHAFLAQTCMDHNNTTPRLLILDMVLPVIPDPRKRGALLRSLAHVFPSATCHVQWAGEVSALRRFLANGLPHEVESVIALQEDPMDLVREYYLDKSK